MYHLGAFFYLCSSLIYDPVLPLSKQQMTQTSASLRSTVLVVAAFAPQEMGQKQFTLHLLPFFLPHPVQPAPSGRAPGQGSRDRAAFPPMTEPLCSQKQQQESTVRALP